MKKITISVLLIILCSPSLFSQKEFTPIFDNNYPRTVGFRNTEATLRRGFFVLDDDYEFVRDTAGRTIRQKITIPEFVDDMFRFPVVMGKMAEEERTGNKNVIAGYEASKLAYPDSKIIMHYNGRNRRPQFKNEKDEPVFPGHWLLRVPNKINQNVDITADQTRIKLEDVSMYTNHNFDRETLTFLIYEEENGTKDFYESEYLIVTKIDLATKELIVERGAFNSTARAFDINKIGIAEIATHNSTRLFHNFTSISPKDRFGRTANEALVDELEHMYNNEFSSFDGIEFDASTVTVIFNTIGGELDVDADGQVDMNGIKNDVNEMYLGFFDFFKELRERMGDDFIIMADSRTAFHNRAFRFLNGIESEEWPQKKDSENLLHWSTGIARHQFVNSHAFNSSTALSQFNINSYLEPNFLRISQVAAACLDAAYTANYHLKQSTNKVVGYNDEMSKGDEFDFSGWLGQARGDMVRLAEQQPNILENEPQSKYTNLNFSTTNELSDTFLPKSEVIVSNIPNSNNEIYFSFKISADQLEKYPEGFNRVCKVTLTQTGNNIPSGKASPVNSNEPYIHEFYVDADGETHGAYFRWLNKDNLQLKFEIEGHENAKIEYIKAHNHPDIIYREFDNGIVIANPSLEPFTFNLEQKFPNITFRRLNGVRQPDVNDGTIVNGNITIPAKDGIFLIKDQVLSTDNNELSTGLSIFPNPTNNVLTISWLNVNNYSATIHSVTGQKVMNKAFKQQRNSIDVSNLSNGFYFIEFSNPTTNETLVKRFVKK